MIELNKKDGIKMGRHAIIVIKNEDKYLQYYEENWSSYLFLNTKLTGENDLEKVEEFVKDTLNIEDISTKYVGEKIHTKFSEKDQIEKEYTHEFYLVTINQDYTLEEPFKWFTYDELLNDERIMKVNSDIVGFIKEFNL